MSPIFVRVTQLTIMLYAQTFIKALSAMARNNFDQYARRIRCAMLWNDQRLLLDTQGTLLDHAWSIDWDSILKYYSGDQLLPNLTHLAYNIESDARYACTFIRPPLSLQSLFNAHWYTIPLLETLPTCAQTLRELTISVLGSGLATEHPDCTAFLSWAACSLQRVVKVQVDALMLEALEHLGSLLALKALSFEVTRGCQVP